jgi:hypothetical protein
MQRVELQEASSLSWLASMLAKVTPRQTSPQQKENKPPAHNTTAASTAAAAAAPPADNGKPSFFRKIFRVFTPRGSNGVRRNASEPTPPPPAAAAAAGQPALTSQKNEGGAATGAAAGRPAPVSQKSEGGAAGWGASPADVAMSGFAAAAVAAAAAVQKEELASHPLSARSSLSESSEDLSQHQARVL